MIFTLSMSVNDPHVLKPFHAKCKERGHEYRFAHLDGDFDRLEEAMKGLKAGDVVVCPNHGFLYWLWKCGIAVGPGTGVKTIWTMHEFVSSKRSMLLNLHWVDYACVPNDYVAKLMEPMFNPRKMLPVGYVQLDTLRQRTVEYIPYLRGPRVLVCPTANFAINGGMKWLAETEVLRSQGVEIHLKHHEMFSHDPWYLEHQYKEKLEEPEYPWVQRINPDSDLCEILPQYDVIVADLGSAMFLAAMTTKPVLVYDSYQWWREPENFDTLDAAFTLRDRFYSFSNGHEMAMLTRAILQHGDPLKEKRLKMVEEMSMCQGVNTFDGAVADRIVEVIESW